MEKKNNPAYAFVAGFIIVIVGAILSICADYANTAVQGHVLSIAATISIVIGALIIAIVYAASS